MKKLRTPLLAFLVLIFSITYPTVTANAVVCFYKSEHVSGMNKICIYDCLGSEAAITISSVSLCPLSINR